MSVNYSSSPHDDLPQSSSSNFSQFEPSCLESLYVSFCFTSIVLLLPLSVFILYLGFQRWNQRRSSAAIMSHCDFLTYNMAVTELIGVFGNTISICAIFAGLVDLKRVAINIETYLWSARMLFPILSCVERYMAVVHPITYLRLRRGGGGPHQKYQHCLHLAAGLCRARFQSTDAKAQRVHADTSRVSNDHLFNLHVVLQPLCSLRSDSSTARGGGREQVENSPIQAEGAPQHPHDNGGVVSEVCSVLLYTQTGTSPLDCLITAANGWLSLPGSLLLLLFLHRAGKLPGWRQDSQSG